MKETRTAFYHSIYGELLLDWGRWQVEQHKQSFRETLRRAEDHLNQAAAFDHSLAYIWYHLPRLHALKARIALERGEDPGPSISTALTVAARGLAINPNNAAIQLAAADAHFAAGQVNVARGEDPATAWAACRSALAAGKRAIPRDYRMFQLEAELELAMAESSQAPNAHLQAAKQACLAGLAIKRDEPMFPKLRAKIALPHSGSHLSAK